MFLSPQIMFYVLQRSFVKQRKKFDKERNPYILQKTHIYINFLSDISCKVDQLGD